MRKFSTTIGAALVLALTFSLGHLVGAQTRPAATAAPSASAEALDAYSLMVRLGKDLPTDRWDAPI
jgi:hypothetical protein